MIGMLDIVAGLGWEPEIRGLLTVVLAMAVLAGSVWLLLVTNTGTRLGSLIALAGFWGWMFIMGIFWWIYGIGWVGSLPSWQVADVFADEPGYEVEGIGDAFVGNVDQLPDTNCFDGDDSFPPEGGVATISVDEVRSSICTPRAIDLLMAYPGPEREIAIREMLNPQTDESRIDAIIVDLGGSLARSPEGGVDDLRSISALSDADRDALFDTIVERSYAEVRANIEANNEALGTDDPRYRTGDALEERVQYAFTNLSIRIDDMSLSTLAGTAPPVIDWALADGVLDLDGWNLQNNSQSGEAAATADAFLREDLFPDGDFIVLDAFQQGGKPGRDGDGMWDRISHTFSSSARIFHPTNYTVINVQRQIAVDADPSLPPPQAEPDPNEPTYSVVMIRDLGNLRVVPFFFTLYSLIFFLITCAVLHWRDLGLREKGLDV